MNDSINDVQWPAKVIALLSAWLAASQSQRERSWSAMKNDTSKHHTLKDSHAST